MHANSTKDFLMTWTLLLLPAITMAMEAPDAGAEVLHGASEIHGAFVRMLDHDPVVTGSPATRSAPDTSSFEQMVNAAVRRGDESSGLRVAAARLPAPERASVPPGASEVNGAFARMLDHEPAVVGGALVSSSAPDGVWFEQLVNAAVHRGDEGTGLLRLASARMPAEGPAVTAR